MLLALTHLPVCFLVPCLLTLSLSLSHYLPISFLFHFLMLIVSLAAAAAAAFSAAGSMQKPELSQHLVFIVVLVEKVWHGGIGAMSLACVCGHCGCKLYAQHYFT